MRKILSRLLCPEIHRDAAGYRRVMYRLDDARWWLGKQHPEAASLAQFVLDAEHHWLTAKEPPRRLEWTWQPPVWVSGIDEFRRWLGSAPFRRALGGPA